MGTPDEAAGQAIAAQAELGQRSPMGGADPAQLGAAAAGAGAGATEVSTADLLATLRELQQRVADVEAERAAERVAKVPPLVSVAEQIAAHLEHRHGALSAWSVLEPAVSKARALVDAAHAAAESGSLEEVRHLGDALAAHLRRVAPAAASADLSYPLQLAEESLPEAAAAAAARR